MKQVDFRKISIKNFLSVGTEPVIIDFKPGLHIITGINKDKQDRRNGVGKSTIADRIIHMCGGLTEREMKAQVLDSMDIERERGITIKAQTVKLNFKSIKTCMLI